MVEWILSGALALAFLGVGAMQLAGAERHVAEFERYGFALHWMKGLGALALLAAAALMFNEFRWIGASLCAVILLGACALHLRHSEWPRLALAATLLAGAGWLAAQGCPWVVGGA